MKTTTEQEELSEEEKKALRGSKFAPLSSLPSTSRFQPRVAHPGGPLRTNKAAALAKFLERKLQEPNGLASINPDLLEIAVKNAKDTVFAGRCRSSEAGTSVKHVNSCGDSKDSCEEGKLESFEKKKHKKKKNKREKKISKKKVLDEDVHIMKKKKSKKKANV